MKLESLSLRWQDGQLAILDQTLLPLKEEWIQIQNTSAMIAAIKKLQVRGAPLIGVAAAFAVAQLALQKSSLGDLRRQALALREARPTAVNLMQAIDRVLNLKSFTHENIVREAEQIFLDDQQLCLRMAKLGADLIQDGDQILTHCNTGGLATAGVGTALGAIQLAHQQGKKIHVYVDETRPLLQGGRLTTYELQKLKIPFTLICDNMAAMLMAQKKITKAFVGSDRIAVNGDFANKIGTYSVAVNCFYHRIPFYVVAPVSTLDLDCPSGKHIPIEERNANEVRGVSGSFGDVLWAQSQAPVYNPSFDVTPAELITGWVLDSGVFTRDQLPFTNKLTSASINV